MNYLYEHYKKTPEKIMDGFFDGGILYQGDWITWETYREINKIKTGGYIGDMVSGSYVSTNREEYQSCFRKELKSFLRQSYLSLLQADVERMEKEIDREYIPHNIGIEPTERWVRNATKVGKNTTLSSEISLRKEAIELIQKHE